MTHPITITVGELRSKLGGLLSMPDDTEVFFGAGDLTVYRVKQRGPVNGPALMQVEFNEVYVVTSSPSA
jgi:hypothetical protein